MATGEINFNPRFFAADTLAAVEKDGVFADETASKTLSAFSNADPRDRALYYELVLGTLRMRGPIDAVIERCSSRSLEKMDPFALQAMRVAICQMINLDRIPAYAAVNAAVDYAKLKNPRSGVSSFVNAVLRKCSRAVSDRDSFFRSLARNERLSHPEWMIRTLDSLLGQDSTQSFCSIANTPPPLTARNILARQSRDKLISILAAEGVSAAPCRFSPCGLSIESKINPSNLGSFSKGLFSIQDEAAQLVSLLLDPRPGEGVLDLCAAPGGKTFHIADLMNGSGRICAVDSSRARLELLEESSRRLGLKNVMTSVQDVTSPLPFEAAAFDRILLDAPCTALGTTRRAPEVRWRTEKDAPSRISRLQSKMLDNASGYLKPGGLLVYSVCTFTPEEGPGVVSRFLEAHTEFTLELPPFGWLDGSMTDGLFVRTWPHLHGTDAFFMARLRKRG